MNSWRFQISVVLGAAWLTTGQPRATAAAGTSAASAAADWGASHFVQVGTHRVHYRSAGDRGPVLLFVHGWAGNAGLWREQVPAFKDRARLLALDLPGHGRSDKPETDYTMDYFARAAVAVLLDARADRATVVGHSMGVAVICRVHAQAPDRVAGLVAVDGFLRRPEFKPEEADRFMAPFCGPGYREHAARFIGSMFPNPGTETLRDWVVDQVLETPQHVMCSAMKGMFGPGQPAWDPSPLQVPLLVINAQSPRWNADYETYVRSRSRRVDYRVIEGPGHFLMLEQPSAFNAALRESLERFGLLDR